MTDIRFIVSWGVGTAPTEDWFSNTIYFAVDLTQPDYQDLANNVATAYRAKGFTLGSRIEVRAYNLADAKPRPERAFAVSASQGSRPQGVPQVALCLSYYSERNLPRQRGRIYLGPFTTSTPRPDTATMTDCLGLATALSNIGGQNVDWSVYSPTKAALGQDPTMSISTAWVDNSWDIVRRRKLDGTSRVSIDVNE